MVHLKITQNWNPDKSSEPSTSIFRFPPTCFPWLPCFYTKWDSSITQIIQSYSILRQTATSKRTTTWDLERVKTQESWESAPTAITGFWAHFGVRKTATFKVDPIELSIESWWLNRDPYNGFIKIPVNNGVVHHPLYTRKTTRGPFFIAQFWILPTWDFFKTIRAASQKPGRLAAGVKSEFGGDGKCPWPPNSEWRGFLVSNGSFG